MTFGKILKVSEHQSYEMVKALAIPLPFMLTVARLMKISPPPPSGYTFDEGPFF